MFADKIGSLRQSYEMKASTKAKDCAVRDSGKVQLGQYSIDVQISENNKQILEAFKQNSGYYHISPKKKNSSPEKQKNSSPSKIPPKAPNPPQPPAEPKECPRIYLFGNNGDYKAPPNPSPSVSPAALTTTPMPISNTIGTTFNLSTTQHNSLSLSATSTSVKQEQFMKQVLETLGILTPNDAKLQFADLVAVAYTRFVDMKSNGRWGLIQKYFKGVGPDDDLSLSLGNTRSIIKKKSLVETQVPAIGSATTLQKKKVKVVEPQTVDQLQKNKSALLCELQQKLKLITEGVKLRKYCFNKQKIEEVTVYFSYDMKCLACKPKDKPPFVHSLLEFSGVTEGARSKNYQKYVGKQYQIDDALVFSMMLKNRTLDLMASTPEQRQRFIEAVRFVKNFT